MGGASVPADRHPPRTRSPIDRRQRTPRCSAVQRRAAAASAGQVVEPDSSFFFAVGFWGRARGALTDSAHVRPTSGRKKLRHAGSQYFAMNACVRSQKRPTSASSSTMSRTLFATSVTCPFLNSRPDSLSVAQCVHACVRACVRACGGRARRTPRRPNRRPRVDVEMFVEVGGGGGGGGIAVVGVGGGDDVTGMADTL